MHFYSRPLAPIKVCFAALIALGLSSSIASAADCNGNSIDDSIDLTAAGFQITNLGGRVSAGTASLLNYALLDIDLDGQKDIALNVSASGAVDSYFSRLDADNYQDLGQSIRLPFVPTRLAAGDFDNNQFLDVGYSDGSSQSAAFNQGNNTFVGLNNRPVTNLTPIPESSSGADEQDGDLNGDGRIDRVRVKDDHTIEILLRDISSTLIPSSEVSFTYFSCNSIGGGQASAQVAPLRDLDGDGDLDPVVLGGIACSGVTGTARQTFVSFLQNDGSANFTERTAGTSGANLFFRDYADINGDAVPDAVFSTVIASISAFPASVPRIEKQGITVIRVDPIRTSRDRNGNNIPDECERAVAGDFGGDRKSDVAVVRPVNGLFLWLVRHSSELNLLQSMQTAFGLSAYDLPYAGDFDGDGKFEPAVVRDAGDAIPSLYGLYWYNLRSDQSAESVQWGLKGDIPVTGHFDADTITDRSVVRNINYQLYWFLRNSGGGRPDPIAWGLGGDTPFAADRNGDGLDELIVSRNYLGGVYWFIRSIDGSYTEQIQWGLAGDTPLAPADIDGDGRADLAIARRAGRFLNFYLLLSGSGARVVNFGLSTDIPYLGNFGGESGAEPALFRPAPAGVFLGEAIHYQRTASGFNRLRPWGFAGDYLIKPEGKGVRP